MTPRHLTTLYLRRRRQTADAASAEAPGARVLTRTQHRWGQIAALTLTTNQDRPRIEFWVNGVYQRRQADLTITVPLEDGDQAEVEVRAVRYRDEAAGGGYVSRHRPRTRRIEWTAPELGTAARFAVDVATGASTPASGDWTQLVEIPADGRWLYRVDAPGEAEGVNYWYRVRPIDSNGNTATAITHGPLKSQPTPKAPSVRITFDNSTQRITVSAEA